MSDGFERVALVSLSISLGAVGNVLAEETELLAPMPPPTVIKLQANDGCFHYSGDAVEFRGRFRKGAYVVVTMQSLDTDGMPVPQEREERIPSSDLPDLASNVSGRWFGPVPVAGTYTVTFMPRAAFGGRALVTICGTTRAPG